MIARWKHSSTVGRFSVLILEAGPSIKQIYKETKHLLERHGVLILAADGPKPLDSKDREILAQQFHRATIKFEKISQWLWIEPQDTEGLFEQTEFGDSADTCLFLKKRPERFTLKKIPTVRGVFKVYFPEELVKLLETQADPGAICMTTDLPDLIIATADKGYTDKLDGLVQTG